MQVQSHYYRTYGLTIASQLALPELPPIAVGEIADVEIVHGELSDILEGGERKNRWVEVRDGVCQITIDGIARYRCEQGKRIVVDQRLGCDTACGVEPGDVRLFLLGSALGALLHQRHWLPLHVSALSTPAGAWAFTGHSGAGKSTLGSWLNRHQGWPMLTDDVAVIKPELSLPLLHPGPPRAKLWRDALQALGIDAHSLVRDLTRAEKFHVSLQEGFQHRAEPLAALVQLERGEAHEPAQLTRLQGVEAFSTIMSSLYRPEMAEAFNCPGRLLADSAALAGKIRVYRYRRPWVLDSFADSLAPLLAEIDACSERPSE